MIFLFLDNKNNQYIEQLQAYPHINELFLSLCVNSRYKLTP